MKSSVTEAARAFIHHNKTEEDYRLDISSKMPLLARAFRLHKDSTVLLFSYNGRNLCLISLHLRAKRSVRLLH